MATADPTTTSQPVMTTAWCDKIKTLANNVSLLTTEQAAWAVAVSISVAVPAAGVTPRPYSGAFTASVIASIRTQIATDLAAAQLALTNCMAGK